MYPCACCGVAYYQPDMLILVRPGGEVWRVCVKCIDFMWHGRNPAMKYRDENGLAAEEALSEQESEGKVESE